MPSPPPAVNVPGLALPPLNLFLCRPQTNSNETQTRCSLHALLVQVFRRSDQLNNDPQLRMIKPAIEEILGVKTVNWEMGEGQHLRLQLTLDQGNAFTSHCVHTDGSTWAGILYLTPDGTCMLHLRRDGSAVLFLLTGERPAWHSPRLANPPINP